MWVCPAIYCLIGGGGGAGVASTLVAGPLIDRSIFQQYGIITGFRAWIGVGYVAA